MIQKGDFIAQVYASYSQFTKAERKVADFIMEHPQEVLYMSITDLSDSCEVGETTVFRFCKTMNLQGYQEFKIKLSLSIKENIRAQDKDPDIENNDIIDTQKLLEANVSVIRETDALLDREEILKIFEHLIPAPKIAFFGVGSSGLIAMLAANKFLRITDKVSCFTDSHMQAMSASLLTTEDTAIIISYSGSTKDSIMTAKLAKEAGAYIVVITHFKKSPLAQYANIVILCGAKEGPLQGSSTTAIMSQMYILEVLYSEYYQQTYQQSYLNNKKSAESIVDKMY